MKIKFRDVSSGIVEARAVLEIKEGIFLNEITILNRNGQINIELPQKSFKGKDGKMHFMDVITFENDDLKTLWMMKVKQEYLNWRQKNKKVLVYES
jgi:hypothetical protein